MKYVGVVQWSLKGGDLQLELLGEDDAVHQLEVSAACAGVLAGALATASEQPNQENRDQQFIRPTGMQTAKTADGEPVVLMTLKGGVELPLVFKAESLGVLVSELQGLMRSIQGGSQFRWN